MDTIKIYMKYVSSLHTGRYEQYIVTFSEKNLLLPSFATCPATENSLLDGTKIAGNDKYIFC